jgi:nicotinate-nucleotide adenylyltransferase
MRIGLLGGTFDPIHVGHLDVARAARAALQLDRVVLLPARVPPHRGEPRASAWHRFAMASIAALADDGLSVSELDMLADSPSYTAATLDRLQARGVDTRALYFVTGADAFRDIRSWKDYPDILERCHFAVVSRPGCPASSLPAHLPELAGRMHETPCAAAPNAGIFLVEAVTAPVSSTDVRARLAGGQSVAGLVPDPIAAHIRKHGLYGADAPKGLA